MAKELNGEPPLPVDLNKMAMKVNGTAPPNGANNRNNGNGNGNNNGDLPTVHQRQVHPPNRNNNNQINNNNNPDLEAGNPLPPYSVRNEKIYQQEVEQHIQIRNYQRQSSDDSNRY